MEKLRWKLEKVLAEDQKKVFQELATAQQFSIEFSSAYNSKKAELHDTQLYINELYEIHQEIQQEIAELNSVNLRKKKQFTRKVVFS